MAQVEKVNRETLTNDEERLLGHYRRLKKHHRDFRIEVLGCFKSGRRSVEIRPTAYERLEIDELEAVFEALD